jgi:hypothetical protein
LAQNTSSAQSLAKQLRQVKAELDKLSQMLPTFDPNRPPENVDAAWINGILDARHQRAEIFGIGLFSDPAWDFLLSVYASHLAHEKCTITEACKKAGITYTTGLRWVGELEKAGLLLRQTDHTDRRIVLVELSRSAVDAMNLYFGDRPQPGKGL